MRLTSKSIHNWKTLALHASIGCHAYKKNNENHFQKKIFGFIFVNSKLKQEFGGIC